MDCAGKATPAPRFTVADGRLQRFRRFGLSNDMIPIERMDDAVAVAVKHDRRKAMCRPGVPFVGGPPCFIAMNADPISLAAPRASPE